MVLDEIDFSLFIFFNTRKEKRYLKTKKNTFFPKNFKMRLYLNKKKKSKS